MRELTIKENIVLHLLASAWNVYLKLQDTKEGWAREEFMTAIHTSQNIILSRPAKEKLNK